MTFYYKYFAGFLYKGIFYLCIVLLIVQEMSSNKKYTLESIIKFGVIIVLFFIAASNSSGVGQNSVAAIFLFVFVARKISFEKIAQYTLIITSVLLIFVVASSYLGIIENYIEISATRTREYLGFRYSLYAPSLFSNVIALWIYLKKETITVKSIVLLAVINYALFLKTNSRLSFILCLLLLVIGLWMKYRIKKVFLSKGVSWLMIISAPVAAYLSINLSLKYTASIEWMQQLNSFLGNRLYYGNRSLQKYGYGLFGRNVEWIGNGLDAYGNKSVETYLYVDCWYVQVLQKYGILFLVAVLFFWALAMYIAYKKKDSYALIILAIIALHALIDDLIIYLYVNSFWFIIGMMLLEKIEKNKKYRIRK